MLVKMLISTGNTNLFLCMKSLFLIHKSAEFLACNTSLHSMRAVVLVEEHM